MLKVLDKTNLPGCSSGEEMQHRNRQHIFLNPFEKASDTRRRINQVMLRSVWNENYGYCQEFCHPAATELELIRCHLSLRQWERFYEVETTITKRANTQYILF